jgi:hypothetical protein
LALLTPLLGVVLLVQQLDGWLAHAAELGQQVAASCAGASSTGASSVEQLSMDFQCLLEAKLCLLAAAAAMPVARMAHGECCRRDLMNLVSRAAAHKCSKAGRSSLSALAAELCSCIYAVADGVASDVVAVSARRCAQLVGTAHSLQRMLSSASASASAAEAAAAAARAAAAACPLGRQAPELALSLSNTVGALLQQMSQQLGPERFSYKVTESLDHGKLRELLAGQG